MLKKHTAKSFKLCKQALRLTIIIDENGIPVEHDISPAKDNDITLGKKYLQNRL